MHSLTKQGKATQLMRQAKNRKCKVACSLFNKALICQA